MRCNSRVIREDWRSPDSNSAMIRPGNIRLVAEFSQREPSCALSHVGERGTGDGGRGTGLEVALSPVPRPPSLRPKARAAESLLPDSRECGARPPRSYPG